MEHYLLNFLPPILVDAAAVENLADRQAILYFEAYYPDTEVPDVVRRKQMIRDAIGFQRV